MAYRFPNKAILIILLLLNVSAGISGQARKVRFHYLTSENGLSHNRVDCMLKDSRGFMWFGTWNGLNRFDGYTFTVFKRDPRDSTSLSGNFIYALAEDQNGNIWVGTENGLNVYLPKYESFIHYHASQSDDPVISSENIQALLIDQTGYLWVGTENGLDRLTLGDDGTVLRSAHFRQAFSYNGLTSGSVTCLFQDRNENIWAGTSEGLNFIRHLSDTVVRYRGNSSVPGTLSSDEIKTVYQDKSGAIWIGTLNGLNSFDRSTGKFRQYYHDPGDAGSLIHNTVMSLTEDADGRLIVGTLGGIGVMNEHNDGFINLTSSGTPFFSLNNEFVNCLLCTPDGNIWVGTERGGINKFNIFQNKFEYFENELNNRNSLSHNTVNSIYEDDRYIWIGTAGGGLNQYNKSAGRFIHHRYVPGQPYGLVSDFISSLFRDSRGNLWTGTWGGGLHLTTDRDGETIRFRNFQADPSDASSIISNYIASITEDRFGNLWLATLGGIDRYDQNSGRFEHFTATYENRNIDRVGCLLFDKNDILWAGTEIGLYRIRPGADGLIDCRTSSPDYFIAGASDTLSISGNYVISVCSDRQGNIWLGTYGNGFSMLSKENTIAEEPVFINFTEADGLCNNIVYSILEDNTGKLWMSTDNGLSRFDSQTGRFINYYTGDGLQSNQFYWAAGYKNPSGKIYFGSMKGLNAFYPDSLSYKHTDNRTLITDLRIFNEKVNVGREYFKRVILNKSIIETDKIVLSYRVKEFAFEFTSLDYVQPEKTLYAYKMQGFDDNWTYVDSKRRFVSYTNLRGGDYTFMVMSSQDGTWDTAQPAEIAITIIPPVWENRWFRLVMILVALSLVLLYISYRTYSLRKQKERLERLVSDRTTKIEEQKQQLELQNARILEQRDKVIDLNKKVQQVNQQQLNFFTYISHEFRSPLTLIITPLEQMLRDRKLEALIGDNLRMVIRSAQRLLHLVNQLMEIRKVETGKLELKASKGDIVAFVREISFSFTGLARQRGINLEIKSLEDIVEMYFDKDILENIIYNLLSNALKYTPDRGTVSVSINIVKPNELPDNEIAVVDKQYYKQLHVTSYTRVTVTDSGPGIPADKVKEIFRRFYRLPSYQNVQGSGIGLYLAKEMVKTHKGLLYVRSVPGSGSSFSVYIPRNSDYLSADEILSDSRTERTNEAAAGRVKISELVHLTDILRDNETAVRRSKLPAILIVDDDQELTAYLKSNLEKNYQVIIAGNGKEGIEKAERYSPELIISDIMMPGMDGLEFCSMIKGDLHTSHIPVIILTARTEADHFIEGFDTGADDYIAKPFNLALLEAKVRNLISNREKLRRLYMQNLVPVPRELTTTRTDEMFFRKTLAVIERNLSDPDFNVQKLAAELGVSRSLLHKKLTAISDVSANDFITSLRLKKSAMLIMEGKMNVSEIAFSVGFNDPKYFSRRFKRQFGKSPTEYFGN